MLSLSGSISTAESRRKEVTCDINKINSSVLLYKTIYTVGVNKVWEDKVASPDKISRAKWWTSPLTTG